MQSMGVNITTLVRYGVYYVIEREIEFGDMIMTLEKEEISWVRGYCNMFLDDKCLCRVLEHLLLRDTYTQESIPALHKIRYEEILVDCTSNSLKHLRSPL